uniref:Enhancer of polycomb-like protein n=1 Tax=Strongyloides venezuelensis TaxID=75913 RepID=A0A0K0F6V5_STRVS
MAHHGTRMPAFRARNIDPNKRMYVYMENELDETTDATASRDITRLPTGMEKDEENESHIQEAINARQAYTLGEKYDQKVALIPTRPTETIDTEIYESLYNKIDPGLINKTEYLRLPLSYLFFNSRYMYDADEEDYEWLNQRSYIKINDFENIIETLERESSDTSVCLPETAENLLKHMPAGIVGEVYDLWLNKRSACTSKGCNSLIPKLKTEARKDSHNSSNPYICFRRRAERMQTRRNRKCEEENYEKMLYLKNNFKKFDEILKEMEKREKLKLNIAQQNENIFSMRLSFDSEAQCIISRQNLSEGVIMDRVTTSLTNVLEEYNDNTNVLVEKSNRYEQIKKRKIRRRKQSSKTVDSEMDNGDKPWSYNTKCFEADESSLDDNRPGKRKSNDEGEGKFEFRRKRGVTYRAPNDVLFKSDNPNYEDLMFSRPEFNMHRDRFFPFTFSSKISGQSITRMVRKALGRCGQTFLEYINESSDEEMPKSLFAVHNKTIHVKFPPSATQNGCNGRYDSDD